MKGLADRRMSIQIEWRNITVLIHQILFHDNSWLMPFLPVVIDIMLLRLCQFTIATIVNT